MPSQGLRPILQPGRNCWRIEHCDSASAIVDAADYFLLARQAMAAANHRILIIGWDFDSRICLDPGNGHARQTLGAFILSLARQKPNRRIDILKWSFGAKKQLLRPSALWMLWRWRRKRAITYCFDGAHPPGCSHHQKILVLDDCLAVCGGIDMAAGRWDTPEHRDNDPRRVLPDGKPYPPWHDVTMMMAGPVARALGELGEDRWYRATSRRLDSPPSVPCEPWPRQLPAQFANVMVGIARTRAAHQDCSEVREIEALYLDMIAATQRFLYIENQYFTCAKVAAAIAARMQEAEPPEIVMVMPRQADGWLEQMAMDAARVYLTREIGKVDHRNRFRIYVPVTAQGQDIYVHAKVSIMDDRLLRIGSSNLNNRSMGLDSECDVVIDAALEQNCDTPAAMAQLRARLLAEHLDVTPEAFEQEFERRGSLVDAIEALRGPGKTLDLLDLVKPGPLDGFIADNELFDPKHADGFLEPLSERGLRKRWHQGMRWWRKRRAGKQSQAGGI